MNKLKELRPVFEVINCSLCCSSNFEIICKKGQFNIPLNLSICKECGLIYLNPRWKKEKYNQFYNLQYDLYYRKDINEKFTSLAKEVYDRIKKYIKKSDKVLEVGSGIGYILTYILSQKKDVRLFAIEPSEKARLILKKKGVKIIGDFIENRLNSKSKYDIIILRHTLEHFLNPNLVLKKLRKILDAKGIIYIAVPSLDNPSMPLTKSSFRVVHTHYFNKETLTQICLKNGLKIVEMKDGEDKEEIYCIAKKRILFNYKINEGNYRNSKNKINKLMVVEPYFLMIFLLKTNIIKILKNLRIDKSIKKLFFK